MYERVSTAAAVLAHGGSMHYFVEIVGWVGAALILAAYALL